MTPGAGTPDRVIVIDDFGKHDLPISDFLSTPLIQRVQLLLGGKVTFFAGDDQLATSDALAALQKRHAAEHKA
jgi:uncharacterized protein YfaA (DUF2138 family)